MPAILVYLLKVNVALLLFCLCYYAILRPLTYYTLNRIYLITAILFSSLYPLIDLTRLFARHEKLVQPLQLVVLEINLQAQPTSQTSYWDWLVIIFWTGVTLMALRLAMQFVSLFKIYQRSEPAHIFNYKVRVITEEANPFSFWQSIYVNPQHYEPTELHSIIAHEQVHVSQWHTLDILLAELSLVFYWFNPGVWLMKKAVAENLEFITDRKILQQGVDAKSYQYSLLYASFNTSPNAVINHFNISTIKKRIKMMNSKRSSAFSLTRYSFIAPAILILLLAFGTTKAAYLKKSLNRVKDATQKVMALTKITDVNPVQSHVKESKTKRAFKAVSTKQLPDTNQVKFKSTFTFTPDTPKINITKVHFTGPDTGYYVVNGKHVTPKQLLEINPNDIVSMQIISSRSAGKVFGAEAKTGAVSIVTKEGKDLAPVTQLLAQINAIKATGTSKETGIYNVTPPKGSANTITITSTSDSSRKKIKGYVSTSYTIAGVGVSNGEVKAPLTATYPAHKDSLKDVVVIGYSSEPGAVKTVRINGTATTAQKAIPLFILNGKEISNEEWKKIKPQTINSINVLDAKSAVKIHGDKGIHGAVIVTTKDTTKETKKN